MRFVLIDRILELKPGDCVTATKSLSLAEEYLADHFPQFPVMPGVLTLEACLQAIGWLVRSTNDFQFNHVQIRSIRALKYGQFLTPGDTLEIFAKILEKTDADYELKFQGTIRGRSAVSGKVVVRECAFSQNLHGLSRVPLETTAIPNDQTCPWIQTHFRKELAKLCPQTANRESKPNT
ncbi:MAG: beta-hydroxyacyl-ACP dehydratase [Thermoguttaceae bacterium]|nr:beta-hydroxyacyl-ACP dehydratase [Thermoguttaceae bacterium]